jgi:hypothetical protein
MAVMITVLMVLPAVSAQERGSSPAGKTPLISDRATFVVFKAMSQLEPGERKDLLRTLSPEMKAAMWQLNIRIFLATHDELAADQRSVLTEIASLLTADLYADQTNLLKVTELQPVRERLAALNDRAMMLFAPNVITDVLLSLGQLSVDREPGTKGLHAKTDSLFLGCDCNASTVGIEDCTGGPCVRGNCVKSQDGCGPEGIYGCNGLCAG